MPTFIGSLSQHEDQNLITPLLDASKGDIAAQKRAIADPSPGLIKCATWKPSGGKKISTDTAIVLENAAHGFKHPNILDLKLGSRLWNEDAPAAKRQKLDEVAGRTTSGSLGFRVAGMKTYAGTNEDANIEVTPAEQEYVEVKNGYKSYNKLYGQSFQADNVGDAFSSYFGGNEESSTMGKKKLKKKRAQSIVRRFIREVESVQYILENEESRMYGASILMVYEGDEETLEESISNEDREEVQTDEDDVDGEEEDDEENARPHKVHALRLIDFAHARWTPGEGPDENALEGVRSILKILKGLVES